MLSLVCLLLSTVSIIINYTSNFSAHTILKWNKYNFILKKTTWSRHRLEKANVSYWQNIKEDGRRVVFKIDEIKQ